MIQIPPRDNVAVALETIAKGEMVNGAAAREEIRRGHKTALEDIPAGGDVIKYGCVIGQAPAEIPAGAWVYVHNVRTGLSEGGSCAYDHKIFPLPETAPRTLRFRLLLRTCIHNR